MDIFKWMKRTPAKRPSPLFMEVQAINDRLDMLIAQMAQARPAPPATRETPVAQPEDVEPYEPFDTGEEVSE